MKNSPAAKFKGSSGFTLIELLVVVLIIGILAAIAVPQYFKVVEKGKVAEALATIDTMRGAQDRYLAAAGAYCTPTKFPGAGLAILCQNNTELDVLQPGLKYFTITSMTPDANTPPGWAMVMTRSDPAPAVYGNYVITVTYNPTTVPPTQFVCSDLSCQKDLMPQ